MSVPDCKRTERSYLEDTRGRYRSRYRTVGKCYTSRTSLLTLGLPGSSTSPHTFQVTWVTIITSKRFHKLTNHMLLSARSPHSCKSPDKYLRKLVDVSTCLELHELLHSLQAYVSQRQLETPCAFDGGQAPDSFGPAGVPCFTSYAIQSKLTTELADLEAFVCRFTPAAICLKCSVTLHTVRVLRAVIFPFCRVCLVLVCSL